MADEQQNQSFQLELPQNVAAEPAKKGMPTWGKILLILAIIFVVVPIVIVVMGAILLAIACGTMMIGPLLKVTNLSVVLILIGIGTILITSLVFSIRTKGKFRKLAPFFAFAMIFGFLFLEGYAHETLGISCNLQNTLSVLSLFNYLGLMLSSVLLVVNVLKK
jgi:hypothetical protein